MRPAKVNHTTRLTFNLPPLRLSVIAASVASLFAWPVLAQQARPDAGTSLQQQGTQPVTAPRPQPNVLPSGFAPKPQLDKLPSASVGVKSFKFSGNTLFTGDQLAAVIQDSVGKDLSLEQLNEVATKVRQHYRSQGYFLTQAYLPRQDVTGGVVEITVLEGYIGQVKASAQKNARLRESFAQGILEAHLKPGQAITETGLERPLLLINDTPGATVKSVIGPGAGVGTADLTADIGQNTAFDDEGFLSKWTGGVVTGSVDLDNWGNRFTGDWRVGGNLAVNNLTGYGDLLSLRGQIATNNRNTNFGRIAWQTPVWYYGTKVGVSYANLNYSLIKDFAALRAEGDGVIKSVFVYHPIIRTRNLNLILQGGFDQKDIEDRTLSTNSVETRRIRIGKIGVQGDWRDGLAGGGLNSFGVTYSSGKLRIEQAALIAFDQGAVGPDTIGKFTKTNIEFQRLQKVTDDLNLLASVNAQFASKNLASAEKMALGGIGGVRAYPTGEASGDEGYTGTIEARYSNPAWRFGGGSLVLAGFYDFGHVKINKVFKGGAGVNLRNLQGVGFGVNLGKEGDYLLRSSVAWRVEREQPVSDVDRTPRVWVQAMKWF